MSTSLWTEADTARAIRFWEEYQKTHDVTGQRGQVVGIDPEGGRIWFGASAVEIKRQMDAEGFEKPVYCVRVGSDYYLRKGDRTWYKVLVDFPFDNQIVRFVDRSVVLERVGGSP